MAATFNLEIIASDHPFFKGECEMLSFTGIDGEYGILANHEPMVTALAAGELRYKINGEWRYAAVSTGFVEIMPKYVVLLADTVERPEDIDINRANEAKARATERLNTQQSIKEYYNSQAALNRALSRIKVTSKYR